MFKCETLDAEKETGTCCRGAMESLLKHSLDEKAIMISNTVYAD